MRHTGQQRSAGNAGMRAGKGSEYDGGHRVPLFMHWPSGDLGRPRDIDRLTAHIDVLPTLAELCGLELPQGVELDGSSLAPLLRGEASSLSGRTLFVHSQRLEYPEKWRKVAAMTERWRLVNGAELYDIAADPAQRDDVAAANASVVQTLRTAYEQWWTSLTPVFDEFVYIGIGAEAEPRTQLHPHDWHVGRGEMPSWHQNHVRNGQMSNGFWAVEVMRPGEYEFTLRRWPEHIGGAIEAKRARIQIGGVDLAQEVDPGAEEVKFTARLTRGRTRLQTWLTTRDDGTRGAYFVYVRRLE